MNTLDAMRIFVRVAELTSFTQTAQALGLPKASVSTAVQNLEAELGTRLLQRTTRRVSLTPDGQVFYERCREILADMEDLTGLFRSDPAALQGQVRVDLPLGIARNVVLPQLPDFMQQHPQVAIELSSTDRRVDLVREGFDCVLRVGGVVDPSLVSRFLGVLPQHNLASATYLEKYGTPRTLDDLARHTVIHYASMPNSKTEGFDYTDSAGQPRKIRMAGRLTVNNSDAYEAACLAGLGIIQAPACGLLPLLASGALVEILPEHRAEPLPVCLLYSHHRHTPKRVKVFMAWLEEVLRPLLLPTPAHVPVARDSTKAP